MKIRSALASAVCEALAPATYRGMRREHLLALGQGLRDGHEGVFEELRALDASTRDAIEQRALGELDLHEALIARVEVGAGSARQVYPCERRDLDTLLLLLCAIGRASAFATELAALDEDAARAGLRTDYPIYKLL